MAIEAYQKRTAYRSLELGKRVKDFFRVNECEARTKADGSGFLTVILSDCVGIIEGRVWDHKPRDQENFKPGSVVFISATMNNYRNKPQLKIYEFNFKDGDTTPSEEQELVRSAPREQKELEEQLLEQLRPGEDERTGAPIGVENQILGKLLRKYIKDPVWWDRFSIWPASKKFHHAYKCGLIEHTGDMCHRINVLCQLDSSINRDIALVGAFLHDSGKLDELSFERGVISYSNYGELIPHISSGHVRFEKKCDEVENFPMDLKALIAHIILSHHRTLEWGSPIVPKTKEARLVHNIDVIDSEAQTFIEVEQEHLTQNEAFAYIHRMRHGLCVNSDNLNDNLNLEGSRALLP